jgi:hypothetical protein
LTRLYACVSFAAAFNKYLNSEQSKAQSNQSGSGIAISRTGSKKDTVIGESRLKNAVILFAVDWRRSSIFIHTQYLSGIFIPPLQT